LNPAYSRTLKSSLPQCKLQTCMQMPDHASCCGAVCYNSLLTIGHMPLILQSTLSFAGCIFPTIVPCLPQALPYLVLYPPTAESQLPTGMGGLKFSEALEPIHTLLSSSLQSSLSTVLIHQYLSQPTSSTVHLCMHLLLLPPGIRAKKKQLLKK
jgi:hypothetical protein